MYFKKPDPENWSTSMFILNIEIISVPQIFLYDFNRICKKFFIDKVDNAMKVDHSFILRVSFKMKRYFISKKYFKWTIKERHILTDRIIHCFSRILSILQFQATLGQLPNQLEFFLVHL